MNLYGKPWTRRQLEARVGRIEKIAGIRRFKEAKFLSEKGETSKIPWADRYNFPQD